MKWTPIEKAKVKFDQLYLVAMTDIRASCGYLEKSETTAKGIVHTFRVDGFEQPQPATHVAIITDPNSSDD